MKYLGVEVEGAPEKAEVEQQATGDGASDEQRSKRWVTERAMWLISDLRSDLVNDLQYPNPDAMCSGLELELCSLVDLRCRDGNARSVCWLVLQCWLRCSVDVFVFRFALVISDLVTLGFWFSDLQCILVFFYFFIFIIWECSSFCLRVFLIFFKGKQIKN